MVDVLHNVCQFFSHESCGQCTPCREGTGWMLKIIDRMRRGQGRREDLDILVDVADRIGIMPGTTICGLADGAGWPVKTAIRKFRAEFEAAIKSGGEEQVRERCRWSGRTNRARLVPTMTADAGAARMVSCADDAATLALRFWRSVRAGLRSVE